MGKREELFIAFGVILFLLLAAGLYWLCRVRSRRAVDSALEEIRLTGLVPGLQGIQFSADGVLGPAGATEPTWEGAVVVLDTSDAPLREVYPNTELFCALGIAGTPVPESVRDYCGDFPILRGPEGCLPSGKSWSVLHICPLGLHDPVQPGQEGVAELEESLSQVAQIYVSGWGLHRDFDKRCAGGEVDLTVLMTVPFSDANSGIMSRAGQVQHFASCLAVASRQNPGKMSSGPRFKLCCDGEEMRRICTEAAYNATREIDKHWGKAGAAR
ncbi:hypothetical protein [Neorickettsia sennetsu]|uniref:Uncharacterized protein n=1 Tax=Ehrlichia sennetsu (strain ATCC VR-367 / Miyayama) TaxID=222891 RepID=Q2GET5_EHRS3|nr:hypothetical protein [Neorickettsia sennetsu]ABD46027.1 hypothetical protein NSE_0111 [Neorickettsia sennetsu str. Miyayama]